MKKIITMLVICSLFSCSDQNETQDGSASNEALRLLKIKDKSNFTNEQLTTIVKYLDVHTEKAYNKKKIDSIKNEIIRGTIHLENTNEKSQFKKTTVDPAPNYAAVYVFQGSVDFYGSIENRDLLFNGFHDIYYQWTMATQVADIYYIASREHITVQDAGISPSNASTGTRYNIITANHASSFIVGIHGTISWRELDGTIIAGKYGANFRTTGLLEGLGTSRQITNTRYANMQAIIQSDGFYYQ